MISICSSTSFIHPLLCSVPNCLHAAASATVVQYTTQTSECGHVNSTPRGSAHNVYRSDLNSVTTDDFRNSWGSIKAHLKYATCYFYIRKHAVQNGTLSLVFVIILQANLVSLWGLWWQMTYSPPHFLLLPLSCF